MAARYGNAWIVCYGDDPHGEAGLAWEEELRGLSRDQLRNGLKGCKRLAGDFPPSVFKFYALCMDFPSVAQVQHEIRTRKHSPFTALVWSFVDTYRLGRAEQRDADRLVQNAYELAYARATEYGGLPQLELQAGTIPEVRLEKIAHSEFCMCGCRE